MDLSEHRPLPEWMRLIPQSPFLANFSLRTLAKRTGQAAIDFSKGGGGGAGGGGSTRTGKARSSLHSTLSCLLTESDDNQFDDVAFLAALQSETRNEIESSGATAAIVNENTNGHEFAIDYHSPSYQGRISVAGKRQGKYYSLHADINEEHSVVSG